MRPVCLFLFILTFDEACVSADAIPRTEAADEGGPTTRGILHLPSFDRTSMLCTQGVGGSFSHHSRSTQNAVDLDTPNDRDQAVYAPSAGVARVHADLASGFGIHVNVDRLDGTYALVGHLKRAIVKDGAEVTEGTLLGIEGCTGNCSGDHVHLSLMEGDAAQPADRGTSVPMSLLLRERPQGEADLVDAADLVCGLPGGKSYASELTAVRRHPDGTLIQVSGDPRVYQLDGGAARHIADEGAFRALGYDFKDVVLVASEEMACYQDGATISSPADLAWMPPPGLRVGTLVREASRNDVYAVTAFGLMPVADWSTVLLLGYDPARIRFVADGTLQRSGLPIGDCTSGFGCVTKQKMSVCAVPFAFGAAEDGGYGGPGDDDNASGGTPEDSDGQQEARPADAGFDETEPDDVAPDGVSPDGGQPDGTTVGGGSGDGAGTPAAPRALHLNWITPFSAPAERITLSGEYRFADGSYGFVWHDLAETHGGPSVSYDLSGVGSGDTLRFSVEFEDGNGHVSWSCLAPFVPGTPEQGTKQGAATATVDGTNVPIQTADDPTSDGCGLMLMIP